MACKKQETSPLWLCLALPRLPLEHGPDHVALCPELVASEEEGLQDLAGHVHMG